MTDSVLVALIMSGTSIACALIAAIASMWLLPSRRLAAAEADLAAERSAHAVTAAELTAERAEKLHLRMQLTKIQGEPDAP